MTRLFIGNKSGTGPVVKILKSDADDPLTIANAQHGKFLFNSEIQQTGYIRQIVRVVADFVSFPPAGGTSTSPNQYLYPSGSTIANCQAIVNSWTNGGNNFQLWYFCKEYFGKTYFPMVEVRQFASGDDTFSGPFVNTTTGQVTGTGQAVSLSGYTAGIAKAAYWNGSTWNLKDAVRVSPSALMSIYDLPDLTDALPNNSTTPVAGQKVIGIDSSIARITLPGRTVADADPDHYILHENKIPAKVIKAGEVNVALGGTATISSVIPLTKWTYMDFHVKRQTDTEWWQPPFYASTDEAQSMSFNYTVSPTGITITNLANFAITIRYAICAASERGFTTGGSKILWKGNDGTQDFIQIKRPGSHDTTYSLDDIMIDTRLSYMPILAQGFLNYPTDFATVISGSNLFKGNRMATVSFANPSAMPLLVKSAAIFAGSGVLQDPYDRNFDPRSVWNAHEVGVSQPSGWTGRASGASTWANIKTTSVDFYAAGGNPRFFVGSNESYPSTMLGLRYYIFGIPSSL
ncbi:hypothetical protein LB521_27705 [Mesorhizobium sp. BR-1-1-8]|uniref:hypothetical protein n=1 Tax=Mesorhizobium sp. BR-1-1-8 TaxID=2876659 RepID=UPI001CCD7ECD|nr:hypothetical protein [Mesorhizobium sp. BR-1-1-8]MBZ9984923.1 hypothetical protein [Mesorhizobium sp. BR-1-1-8]